MGDENPAVGAGTSEGLKHIADAGSRAVSEEDVGRMHVRLTGPGLVPRATTGQVDDEVVIGAAIDGHGKIVLNNCDLKDIQPSLARDPLASQGADGVAAAAFGRIAVVGGGAGTAMDRLV
ncbi:hypothetical protein [Synechococcus sp. CCY 9618]|uniref:hypothetical protein n=1 Tax=Synechococcus sp. CCY 9618 TaxID=2815602 RepID=UPI001C21F724|nr:hypothetical protein [Synechococcus sp. CCY 9618]